MVRLAFIVILTAALSPAFADPLTPARLAELPPQTRDAWQAYVRQSHAAALADEAAVKAELLANNLPHATKAPSGGDFKVKQKPADPWYAGDEAKTLADAILSYQTPSGGWSKHLGFSRGPRRPGMLFTSQNEPGQPAHYVATFDNNSTVAEMNFLANVWLATGRDDCRAAFAKGLAFVVAAQYPNGGWPQVYPLEGGYHDDVTFNDNAMTNVLELLQGIRSGEPAYALLDAPQRTQAAAALVKGLDFVLRSQVVVDGRKTVWCAQFDPITTKPSSARKMEPATLSGAESARLLKFLMTLPRPSPELVGGIESALTWFEGAKVEAAATTEPAKPRWARFYDLKTGKPVFPGRDGVVYDTFEAMAAHNKLGYDYYTTQPQSIITNGQKKWRKMLAGQAAAN